MRLARAEEDYHRYLQLEGAAVGNNAIVRFVSDQERASYIQIAPEFLEDLLPEREVVPPNLVNAAEAVVRAWERAQEAMAPEGFMAVGAAIRELKAELATKTA